MELILLSIHFILFPTSMTSSSGVSKQLAEEYSRAVRDSLMAARLLTSQLVTSHQHQTQPVTLTSQIFSTHKQHQDPAIKILHSSLFSVPNLSYGCQTLVEEISRCVLHTVLQVVRIERICFTNKTIKTVRRNRRRTRLRKCHDSSSDESEEDGEEEDDD